MAWNIYNYEKQRYSSITKKSEKNTKGGVDEERINFVKGVYERE